MTVSNINLRNYSSALDRRDTSNRFGALLTTMLIKDLSISVARQARLESPSNIVQRVESYFTNLILDTNKIRRERVKFRQKAKAAAIRDRNQRSEEDQVPLL